MNQIKVISAEEFRQCQQDPAHCVIDVRDRPDFAAGSEAKICWPVSEIDANSVSEFVRDQKLAPNQTLVLLCARGIRAQQAADKLKGLVPNPILVVEGGHAALAALGKKSISIERQVRMVMGSLVLLGLIGSTLWHPYWLGLTLFVGCALVFSGITDWCGMAKVLVKMPWNK